MNQELSLAALSDRMYRGYGSGPTVGLDYFRPYLDALSAIGPVSVIAHQLKNFPSPYGRDFVLSTPQLWAKMESADWLELMTRLAPREEPSPLVDPSGDYDDLVFLVAYLGIDPFGAMSRVAGGVEADKARQYFVKFPDLLCLAEEDLDDLDGTYFMSREELEEVSARLLREGVFAPHTPSLAKSSAP